MSSINYGSEQKQFNIHRKIKNFDSNNKSKFHNFGEFVYGEQISKKY